MTPERRCGICGVRIDLYEALTRHDAEKHRLFERMRAAEHAREPLSPLAHDLAEAKERDKPR